MAKCILGLYQTNDWLTQFSVNEVAISMNITSSSNGQDNYKISNVGINICLCC